VIKYVKICGNNYVVYGNNRLQAARILGITDELTYEEVTLPFKGFNTEEDVINSYGETFNPQCTDMAIWQFRLDFVPEKAVRSRYSALPATMTENMAEDFPWWSDIQPPLGFEVWIDAILPQIPSWSESMRIWGNERSDTACVCYVEENKNRVELIEFRVDVQKLSSGFVKQICDLAQRLECVLVTSDHRVLVPDKSAVLRAIDNSTAKKFLEDPISTLRGLDQSKLEFRDFSEKDKEDDVPPKR